MLCLAIIGISILILVIAGFILRIVNRKKFQEILESSAFFKGMMIYFGGIIAIFVIIWFVGTMTDIYNEGEEAGQEIHENNQTCSLLSDTYNKCSYSYIEKRCVCKKR